MQYPEKIELVDLLAPSSIPSPEGKQATAVAEDHASMLHFEVLAESLMRTGLCVAKGGVASRRLLSHLASM